MLDSTGIENVIRQRRSVRGFLRKEIPRDTLKKIFELAQRAPSNCNIQPWHVYVCSGASRKRLEKQMLKNEENLTEKQRPRLQKLLSMNETLNTVYILKDQLKIRIFGWW